MSLSKHAPDDSRPWLGLVVNTTLRKVDTGHEEGSLEAIGLEHVQQVRSVRVGAVIVSNGDLSGILAGIDTLATIQDISNLGTRSIARATAWRDYVGIRSRSILEQGIRSLTVVTALTTPASRATAVTLSTCGAAE